MNQVDKEYMQSKGFLDENERAVDARLQEAALSEAAMFAGSVLAAGHDLEHLQMVTSYMEELAGERPSRLNSSAKLSKLSDQMMG